MASIHISFEKLDLCLSAYSNYNAFCKQRCNVAGKINYSTVFMKLLQQTKNNEKVLSISLLYRQLLFQKNLHLGNLTPVKQKIFQIPENQSLQPNQAKGDPPQFIEESRKSNVT